MSFATAAAQKHFSHSNASSQKAKIAIIIDDIGNTRADAAAFELPEKVTFSILPHTQFSTNFSQWAQQQGRDVMLHMPMESLHGEALGDGGILSTMYPEQVEQQLFRALQSVPHAIGLNNHMGSKLTQLTLPMTVVMEVLQNNKMFFVDSRTTKFSKAYRIAQKHGVQSAQRQIFLDHYATEEFLARQLKALIRKARKDGSAIGIAHPYPVSIAFLREHLLDLPDDIELVGISEYLGETDDFEYRAPRLARKEIQQASDAAPQ